MFPQANPTNQQAPTSFMNQQGIQLLGNPQIQAASAAPVVNPGNFNTTALQSTPEVASMIKALKGGAQ